jgi:hypothetical protein
MKNRKKSKFQRTHLEWQIVQAIHDAGLTFEEFAEKMGTSKGNISRDLTTRGLGKSSFLRVQKMADILDMEFFPILLPRNGNLKKFKFKFGAGEGVRTLDLKLGKLAL